MAAVLEVGKWVALLESRPLSALLVPGYVVVILGSVVGARFSSPGAPCPCVLSAACYD